MEKNWELCQLLIKFCLFVANCYRSYWLASRIAARDTSACLLCIWLLAGRLPGLITTDKGLVSWPGCCRLQVRVLFLHMIWPLSICIFTLSGEYSGKGDWERTAREAGGKPVEIITLEVRKNNHVSHKVGWCVVNSGKMLLKWLAKWGCKCSSRFSRWNREAVNICAEFSNMRNILLWQWWKWN